MFSILDLEERKWYVLLPFHSLFYSFRCFDPKREVGEKGGGRRAPRVCWMKSKNCKAEWILVSRIAGNYAIGENLSEPFVETSQGVSLLQRDELEMLQRCLHTHFNDMIRRDHSSFTCIGTVIPVDGGLIARWQDQSPFNCRSKQIEAHMHPRGKGMEIEGSHVRLSSQGHLSGDMSRRLKILATCSYGLLDLVCDIEPVCVST